MMKGVHGHRQTETQWFAEFQARRVRRQGMASLTSSEAYGSYVPFDIRVSMS